ncbi:glycerol acyltransferase, partial [Streptomyces californicus]
MADAKVIPFDDDRSRSGGASRPARRRTGAGGGSGGRGDGPAAPGLSLINKTQPTRQKQIPPSGYVHH